MALRCVAGGGGAYLTPPRSRCCGAGAARPEATTTKARGLGLSLRVSSSPCSKARGLIRCSNDSSPLGDGQRLARKKGRNEAWEALKAMVEDMFRPLVRNLSEIRSLRSGYDLEDYQIGMLCGAFLCSVGCYQLWKSAPSVCVDVALAYGFYKLTVVSSELHRQGKCNDVLTRLKFGTILIMVLKDLKKAYVPLDFIRMVLFLVYILAFLFDIAGVKKYGRKGLICFVNILKTRGGIKEMWRIMWYPGYVSPYDDVDWSDVGA